LVEKRGGTFTLVCGVRNITLIFIIYFVDENKYISGGSCYVLPLLIYKTINMASKNIRKYRSWCKYLKSDFRTILGLLRVRSVVMDDMPSIVHRMRF